MIENEKKILECEKILNYEFRDKSFLFEALTHSSYAYENKKKKNNERLEFLGDAVLKLAVSDYLYLENPAFDEGKMTKMRALIISDKTLAEIALDKKIGKVLFVSKREERSGGRKRHSILANALEAIFGAVYLDGGYQEAAKVIITLLQKVLDCGEDISLLDFKSSFQELIQKENGTLPKYEVVKTQGPDHKRVFVVEGNVTIKDKMFVAEGRGNTKKLAEQDVAEKLFKKLTAFLK
jgi:ribonuclease III